MPILNAMPTPSIMLNNVRQRPTAFRIGYGIRAAQPIAGTQLGVTRLTASAWALMADLLPSSRSTVAVQLDQALAARQTAEGYAKGWRVGARTTTLQGVGSLRTTGAYFREEKPMSRSGSRTIDILLVEDNPGDVRLTIEGLA